METGAFSVSRERRPFYARSRRRAKRLKVPSPVHRSILSLPVMHRRSAPNVKAGKVQKHNNWAPDPGDYYRVPQRLPVVDRRRPGRGYRHLLRRGDVKRFIALLPDWEELSRGLDAVVLAPGSPHRYGYHSSGVVHVCAWPTQLWDTIDLAGYERDRSMLERLSVPAERRGREETTSTTIPRRSKPAPSTPGAASIPVHYPRVRSGTSAASSAQCLPRRTSWKVRRHARAASHALHRGSPGLRPQPRARPLRHAARLP